MKDRRLELRLSEQEYDRLYTLAAADPDCRMKSGRASLSAYVRKHIIWSGSDPYDLRREVRSLTFQVRKAGVNIKQAARWINAGYGSSSELEKMEACQEKIQSLLEEILLLLKTGPREGA